MLALSITFEERMSKEKKGILKAPILVILWCGACGIFGFVGCLLLLMGFFFNLQNW